MSFFYERQSEPSEPRWGKLPMRLAWVLKKPMTGGLLPARARCFWHVVVRGYFYEMCGHCGRPVGLVWSAPNELWCEVYGRREGVRCIPCFDKALWGIAVPTAWVPIPLDQLGPEGGGPGGARP